MSGTETRESALRTTGRRTLALFAAAALLATLVAWIVHPRSARAAGMTIVTIQFDDGYADQIGALPVLQAHNMTATFFVNSGPILANDPTRLSVAQLNQLGAAGNEIAGHTLDHVNIQPLSTAEARFEVCTDRNNLLAMGFQVTSFAYPFGSFDSGSEAVVQACGYNSGRGVSGITLKGPYGETVPPLDPYATRTPPAIKKATKLSTLERYVLNAEADALTSGQTRWVQLFFHHFCSAHCGAYTVQPTKFAAFLDFLQLEVAAGRVTVQTTAQVIGGPVNPPVTP
jgi:peptidoglycan/xylan/chitin deacetylase (PgdA/CDA1 family)